MRSAIAIVTGAWVLASFGAHAALDSGRALEVSRAAVGSRPAAHAFTDGNGRRVTLADFRGKPLVVSFVYTGCTQVCPTTTRFLARAVREARKVLGPGAFRVASIGFNVPIDNPMSMRVFARQQGVDGDADWLLLVPDAGAAASLARDFGFTFEPQSGGFDHLMQVTVLDAEGRVHAQVYGESFALPMLVQPLRELVLGEPRAASLDSWLERVRLVCTVYDPASGRYRLDYGLFIEIGVGVSCLALTLLFLLRERRRARRPC